MKHRMPKHVSSRVLNFNRNLSPTSDLHFVTSARIACTATTIWSLPRIPPAQDTQTYHTLNAQNIITWTDTLGSHAPRREEAVARSPATLAHYIWYIHVKLYYSFLSYQSLKEELQLPTRHAKYAGLGSELNHRRGNAAHSRTPRGDGGGWDHKIPICI